MLLYQKMRKTIFVCFLGSSYEYLNFVLPSYEEIQPNYSICQYQSAKIPFNLMWLILKAYPEISVPYKYPKSCSILHKFHMLSV